MKVIAKISFVYILSVLVFTSLIILVHYIPADAMRENARAFNERVRQEGVRKDLLGFELFPIGNYTDDIMLNVAMSAGGKHVLRDAMMNDYYVPEDYDSLPDYTQKVIDGAVASQEKKSYGTYWHGYQLLFRPALVFFNYAQLRVTNYIFQFLLLFMCCYLFVAKISWKVMLAFLCSLFAVAFPLVPLSLNFSICFYIAFISTVCVLRFPKLTEARHSLFCLFFLIGGLTSFFDFLTLPQLTLGFPLLSYLLMKNPRSAWKDVILLSLLWALGYGLIWATKWIMVYLLLGENVLSDAMESVATRFGQDCHGEEMTLSHIGARIWNALEKRHLFVHVSCLLLFLLLAIVAYARAMADRSSLRKYAYLLLIASIVPVWYMALRNHSIIHFRFVWRALVLTIFSLSLFVCYTIKPEKIRKFNGREKDSRAHTVL